MLNPFVLFGFLFSYSNIVSTLTTMNNFVSSAYFGIFLLVIFSWHMNGMEWNKAYGMK